MAVVAGLALAVLGGGVSAAYEYNQLRDTRDLPVESAYVVSSEPTGETERRRRRTCSVDRTVFRSVDPPAGLPAEFVRIGCFEGEVGERKDLVREVGADGMVTVSFDPPRSAGDLVGRSLLVMAVVFPVAALAVALQSRLGRRRARIGA